MVKILDVYKTPLSGYLEDAYPLTVALSSESSYEWIYSNYIQLVFQEPRKYDNQPVKFFKLSCKSGYIWDSDCPLLCCDTISRDMMAEIGIDIIDYICKAIYNKHYVRVYLDEFYLPYRSEYKRIHYIHENFFFGYDQVEKKLHGLAYVTDELGYHFKTVTVHMNEVREAYRAANVDSVQQSRIMLMSCNKEKYYEFDIKVVKHNIYEYIHSIQGDQKYAEINNPNSDYTFGLRIYDKLIRYYRTNVQFKSVIPLQILYEHKKLMLNRIKFMTENGYIYYEKDIIDGYEEIINKTFICKMLVLKYIYASTNNNYKKLINSLKRIKEMDKALMERLFQSLDSIEGGNKEGYRYSRWGKWCNVAYCFNKKLNNQFEIVFKLHIINDKVRGYISICNEECLDEHKVPFRLRFDVKREIFVIIRGDGDNDILLNGVKCLPNNIYQVRFKIDLVNNRYSIEISDENQFDKYENGCTKEISSQIQYINSIAVIHENSYRFAINNLRCIVGSDEMELL